ncbi:MAG: tRNA lysidine(34) synthetase TilS [Chthoniobacterales bacterium]
MKFSLSLPLGEPLLLGISGGLDSVALFYLLLELGYQKIILCHFDHQLRGEESRADASFVKALAIVHHLAYEIGSEDVAGRAAREHLSLETAARAARYEFFAAVAKKKNIKTILLAHHADDQVETIFFNFLRGSGSSGLAGMLPISTRKINDIELRIIRPLLTVSKKELADFLAEKNIPFRHDSSNDTLLPTRNRLRHRLIPLLDQIFGTSYRDAVRRAASILSEEDDFLQSLAAPLAAKEELPTHELAKLPLALQRRVVYTWLRHHGFEDIGFAEVERILSLQNLDGPAKVNLPTCRHARRRAGVIFVE